MGIIEWLEAFGTPLRFLSFLVDFFINLVKDAINAIKEHIVNFFHSIFNDAVNAVNQNLLQPLQQSLGPFYPVALAFIGGALIYALVWVIVSIKNLL